MLLFMLLKVTSLQELLNIKPLKNGINGRAFVVVDAVAKSGVHIEVLLQAVVETPVAADEAHQKQSAFVTQLHWITLQGVLFISSYFSVIPISCGDNCRAVSNYAFVFAL
jgi:hypothetical protein